MLSIKVKNMIKENWDCHAWGRVELGSRLQCYLRWSGLASLRTWHLSKDSDEVKEQPCGHVSGECALGRKNSQCKSPKVLVGQQRGCQAGMEWVGRWGKRGESQIAPQGLAEHFRTQAFPPNETLTGVGFWEEWCDLIQVCKGSLLAAV